MHQNEALLLTGDDSDTVFEKWFSPEVLTSPGIASIDLRDHLAHDGNNHPTSVKLEMYSVLAPKENIFFSEYSVSLT